MTFLPLETIEAQSPAYPAPGSLAPPVSIISAGEPDAVVVEREAKSAIPLSVATRPIRDLVDPESSRTGSPDSLFSDLSNAELRARAVHVLATLTRLVRKAARRRHGPLVSHDSDQVILEWIEPHGRLAILIDEDPRESGWSVVMEGSHGRARAYGDSLAEDVLTRVVSLFFRDRVFSQAA